MDFSEGTVIDATGRGSCLATPYRDEGYIRITITPMDGEPVTVQLRGWEARAVASILRKVSEGIA